MPTEKQHVYNPAIDVLRIISILAVVCIHTTTKTIQATSNDLEHIPWTLLLNQAARFAVPLFFMISGFVLELNYPFHTDYFAYLKKRLSKILLPYVFWSAIYFFLVHNYSNPVDFLKTLAEGTASYQLYFIPALLILYLIFPLIHRYYRVLANVWSMLFLGGIEVALLAYDYYVHPLHIFMPLSVALLNFYIFMLGTIAAHHQHILLTWIEKVKYVLLVVIILLIGEIFLQGKLRYLQTHNYLSFYSQWRPSVLLYTILTAGLFYYVSQKKISHSSIIKKLARLSFFVFFVHVIILEVIWNIAGNAIFQQIQPTFDKQLWFDPLFFLLTAGTSFAIAFVAQKIPLLKALTG